MHILDSELRLITPTDPEGAGPPVTMGKPRRLLRATVASLLTKLTHDYLVHSLRDWLTRKQRETRRGRAELRLAERSALWNAKPENRHLPSGLGVGEHPCSDEEEGLDRAATQDDEAGGAGAWRSRRPDLCSLECWNSCRDCRSPAGRRESTEHDPGCRAGPATPRC